MTRNVVGVALLRLMLKETSPASLSLQLGCVTIVGIMAAKFAQSEPPGPQAGSPIGRTATDAVPVSCAEHVPIVAKTLKFVFAVKLPVEMLMFPPVLTTLAITTFPALFRNSYVTPFCVPLMLIVVEVPEQIKPEAGATASVISGEGFTVIVSLSVSSIEHVPLFATIAYVTLAGVAGKLPVGKLSVAPFPA